MRRITLVICALAVLVGCAKEKPTVVAKVGKAEISLKEVEKRVPTRKFQSEAEEMDARRSALDKIIENKLYLLEAKDQGRHETDEFKKRLEDLTSDVAIKQMYEDLIVAKYEGTDEDAKVLWERLKQEAKVRICVLGSEEEAKKTLEELKAGADFGQLVEEKSTDKRSAAKGGSLGYMKWTDRPDAFSQVAFALEEGEMSDVVKIGGEYYIILLDDKVEVEPKDFEQEKARLKEMTTMRQRSGAAEDFVEDLKDKAGIAYEEEVLAWLADKLTSEAGQAKQASEKFSPEENGQVLVRFGNQEWSVEETIGRFGSRMPPFTDLASVRQGVEFSVVRELLWQEAKRRGVHKSDAVEDAVDSRKDAWLVTELRREASQIATQPTDDELQDYYDTHKEERFKDKAFEEVKDRVRVMLGTELKQQKTQEFVDGLKQKYEIEIYEENLVVAKETEEEEGE
jgi:parvulin-like peptidyl-prolyl isomerase